MLRHLPFILRNALRNRRRSLLTLTSMAVSLCLLGILVSLYVGLFLAPNQTPAGARRLIVRHKVSITQVMPISHKQRILAVPHVKAVTNWQWFGGMYKDSRDPKNFFARFVVEPSELLKTRPEIEMPEDQRHEFLRLRTGAIANEELARKHGWKLGERITIVGDIFPVTLEFKLVGIYRQPEEGDNFFFHWDYLQEALRASPGRADYIGAFVLIVDEPENVAGVAKTVDATFANSPFPSKTETEKEMMLSFVAFLGNLRLFLAAVCSAVTFTILLVSANTIAMAVRERVRETAILRTIGFTPREILLLILGEACLIGIAGGIAGCGLCVMLSLWLRKVLAESGGFIFPLMPPYVGAALVVAAIIIAIGSATVPAYFASRRNVVEALRNAG